MARPIKALLAVAVLACLSAAPATSVGAQSTAVAFNGLKQDPSLPVEVTADELRVSQANNSAVFTGHVVVGQGKMRLTAPRVRVEYAPAAAAGSGSQTAQKGRISKMFASGGVTFTSGDQAAQADSAVYTVADGFVEMTGNVLLTQGANVMAGQKLTINLVTGIGHMEGRVQTVFNPKPSANSPAPAQPKTQP